MPKRRQSETTSGAILEAAVRLFSERGPDAVGIREVARVAGVQPNTITHHFRTKANLRRRALAHALEFGFSMNEIIERHAASRPRTRQAKADAITSFVVDVFEAVNGPDFARTAALISHAILGDDVEQKKLLMEAFAGSESGFMSHMESMGIHLTFHQTMFFTYYFWSQIYFWALGRDMILVDLEVDEMPNGYIRTFATEVGRTCCLMLGLPEPTSSRWSELSKPS